MSSIIILGAGITGLSAGIITQGKIFEQNNVSGGICRSYYIKSGEIKRLVTPPRDRDAYHFDIGGGHWIWGNNKYVQMFLDSLVDMKQYVRKSSVYISEFNKLIPYPIQENLAYFNSDEVKNILSEILVNKDEVKNISLKKWLEINFGSTLCHLFFWPYNERYTSGLYDKISISESYKNPMNILNILKGISTKQLINTGYNQYFQYPREGLNAITNSMEKLTSVNYNKKVCKIDPVKKKVYFNDDTRIDYKYLISTLPLNETMHLTEQESGRQDPYTSVLVINLGAKRGKNCPTDHWIYFPKSKSGFYRIGFYSNIDLKFLPKNNIDKVSCYIEVSFYNSKKNDIKVTEISQAIIDELKELDYIDEVEVIDTNWINIAYTWSWIESTWIGDSIKELENHDIYSVGRYGKWNNQGMIDSINDGIQIGNIIKNIKNKL